MTSDRSGSDRRTFLAQVIGACAAFVAAVVGIPAVGAAVAPALKQEEAAWLPVGQPSSYPTGTPVPASISVAQTDGWIQTTQVHTVWILKQSETQFTAYNGRCTHLGCAYSWQTEQNQFTCPCHAGVYAVDGHVLAGPPPRALDTLPIRIEGGELQVQYQDYQLGIPEKAPA